MKTPRKKTHIQTYKKKKKNVYKTIDILNNKLTNKINFTKLSCSPKKELTFTCFTKDELIELKNAWNRINTDKINTNDSYEIWCLLKQKLSNTCSNESCWLKQNFIKNNTNIKLIESFSPAHPKDWIKNPYEWLSNIDIMNVMEQYKKVYPCFDFLGPSPIDYDYKLSINECVWNDLCKYELKKSISNKKKKIGVVFNLDTHEKGGSHWVSLFINIPKQFIFYFDSAGASIPKQLEKFVKKVEEQGKECNINFVFDQNHPFQHQFSNTECGMYSLYFISNMLEDKLSIQYLKTKRLPDSLMKKYRKIYFNSPEYINS
jgi:hypothetical protein